MRGLPTSMGPARGLPGAARRGGVAAAPAFTPLDYSPLRAYHAPWDFDGSAPSAVVARWQNSGVVDNDPLETWTDWSDQEAHAQQATGSKQARIRNAANGINAAAPSYLFDGVDDAYDAQSLTVGATGIVVFFVGSPAAAVKFVYEHGANASTGAGSWMLGVPGGSTEFAVRYRRASDFDARRAQWANANPHIAMQRFIPGDANPHRFRVDDVDAVIASSTSGSPTGNVTSNLYIGARLAGTTAPYLGLYTSLWIFDGLTDEQVEDVYNWLVANTGFAP